VADAGLTVSGFRPRSLLFVPGDRLDRLDKALGSGADAVILDLEDAVAPSSKAAARASVLAQLTQEPQAERVVVRINAPSTPAGLADLAALTEAAPPACAGLLVPKAESPDVLAAVGAALAEAGRELPLAALIESAAGLRRAAEIARAPGLVALALGPLDLAAQLEARLDPAAMASVRLALRLAAVEGGVELWDGPSTALEDAALVGEDAAAAAALGFTGKLCIHPRQVEAVNAAFSPSPEALDAARALLAAAEGQAGAFRFEGKMVDAPVLARARALLARARRDG
jgi:citrate lyase subunit beta / citryl-CoA lyase